MVTRTKTKEQVIDALRAALNAGTIAGNAKIQELAKQNATRGKMLEPCGNSYLLLNVDGRTSIGKIFLTINENGISIERIQGLGLRVAFRFSFNMVPPVTGQEWSINEKANKAAEKVIKEQLGIDVSTIDYIN